MRDSRLTLAAVAATMFRGICHSTEMTSLPGPVLGRIAQTYTTAPAADLFRGAQR